MAFKKKPPEPEEQPGAPEWMLTFSDCLTLLLTFFVLLMTFSSIGVETIPGLSNAFRKVMPGFKSSDQMYRNTLKTVMEANPVESVMEGSEHATLEQGTSGSLKESTEFSDPFEPRVFMIPSVKVFAGRATAISPQGRRMLDTLAAYLRRVTNGVIISEQGASGTLKDNHIGLMRASAVVDYLTTKGGLERSRFGLSSSNAAISQSLSLDRQGDTKETSGGTLEIVLLGQGINQ